MTQLLVEGFGTYGTGIAVSGSGVEAVGLAMLSGVWSSIPSFQNLLRPLGIGQLPWDAQNTDFYFYRNMQASSIDPCTSDLRNRFVGHGFSSWHSRPPHEIRRLPCSGTRRSPR